MSKPPNKKINLKAKMFTKEFITYIITAIIFLALAITGYMLTKRDKDELAKNGVITKAKVIGINRRLNRGQYITYEYIVKNIKYQENEIMEVKVEVGDTIMIMYSEIDPENSTVVWN